MKGAIENSIHSFSNISLKEMNGVSLMKRTDTKFIIPQSKLCTVLDAVSDEYQVLEIEDNRVMRYKSLYFDTYNHQFYTDHHNNRCNRTKIRIRNYIESDLYFLEIKQKNNKGVTHKSRVQIDNFETDLPENHLAFINSTISKDYQLKPTLWNGFNRITLVNAFNQERITVDFGLNFQFSNTSKSFENLVIIEVKQERYNRNTPIVSKLKKLGSHPYSISKYCIGMLNLYDHLNHNRFKKKLLQINKLTQAS